MFPSVRREIVLPARRERVWEALTDPAQLREWFANEVELDVRPGGAGAFRWGDGSERTARVERVEPERRLGFTWSDESGASTLVELALEDCDDGTRVTVVESAAVPETRAAAFAPVGEWSWGIELLAALPRLRRLARAYA